MTAGKRPAPGPSAEETREAREAVSRAIKRLNVLETIIIGAAVVIALGGGWLGAILARSVFDFPFRTTWMVLSLLLFVVPAAIAWTMERRGRRMRARQREQMDPDNPTDGPAARGRN